MTETAGILPLALAFFCLALWINLFKLASPRWRFEFFAIDFAVGALITSAIAAATLGNLGSDLSFGDRLLVASKTSQALVFFGGCLVGLSALMIFGAVRLSGITASLTIALSLAGLPNAVLNFRSAGLAKSGVIIFLLLAALLSGLRAIRGQDSPAPPQKNTRQPKRSSLRRSTKGLLLALAAGFFSGVAIPILFSGLSGDFGVGPYAGMLVASAGGLVAIAPLVLFLLNIAIDLPPGTLRGYWSKQITKHQHRYGLLAGVLWAAGILAYLTRRLTAPDIASTSIPNATAISALVVGTLCGIVFWKESKQTKSQLALLGGVLLFACGALLSVLGFNS